MKATHDRIESLDVIRGAALLGILLMNITGFGLHRQAYVDPNAAGGATGADLWAWIVTQIGFEGTQRGLFSILFGAGAVLFMTRLEAAGRRDAADLYVRRNLWLILFGMVNAFILLWPGDILYCYGVTALFLFGFRRLSGRALLLVGLAGLIAGAAWNLKDTSDLMDMHRSYESAAAAQARGRTLNDDQKGAISAWRKMEKNARPDAAALQEDAKEHRSGYGTAFLAAAGENARVQSWTLYRYFFDVFAMMVIGMGLLKLGVLTLERPNRLYLAMLVLGWGVGLTVNVAETRWIIVHDFSLVAFGQADISYDLGRVAMTIGHLGGLLLFVRSGILPWLRRSLAAVGRMALTNYLSHSLICAILFTGFGLYGRLARHELYYIVFAIWAAQLVLSPIWLRHFRFGPAEWLWRALTYGARPEMRREPRRAAAMAAA